MIEQQNPTRIFNAIKKKIPPKTHIQTNQAIIQSSLPTKQRIGPYKILSQIRHESTKNDDLSDYICMREIAPSKVLKKAQFQEFNSLKDDLKKSFTLLCKIFPLFDEEQRQRSREITNKITRSIWIIKTHQEYSKTLQKILLPVHKESIYNSEDTLFIEMNIDELPLPLSSFSTFAPLLSLKSNSKILSQLFCLNLFYNALLKLGRPLFKLTEILASKNKISLKDVNIFFNDILVSQNIYFQSKSGELYLLLIKDRSLFLNSHTLKNQTQDNIYLKREPLDLQSIQKQLLKKISQIFWSLSINNFSDKYNNKFQQELQASFFNNLLASMIKGELDLQQAIEILESKQKRKSFINEKITITGKKIFQRYEMRNHSYNTRQEQLFKVDKNQIKNELDLMKSDNATQFVFYNSKGEKKRKSVQRKLTGKRNTIDVLFENHSRKDIPPSFESRSQQKKNRLFRHANNLKTRQRKTFSLTGQQNKHNFTTIKQSKTGSSIIRETVNLNQNDFVNTCENFSFMKNSASNKFNRKNVSQTIELGDMGFNSKIIENHESQNEKDYGKMQNDFLSREHLVNFLKVNVNHSIVDLKSSTQKVESIVHNNLLNSPFKIQFVSAKNQTLDLDRRQSAASKSKNRRYYHINNFISISSNQLTIQTLIKSQKKLLQYSKQTSKSRQQELLNRSQQKALAIFNREFKTTEALKQKLDDQIKPQHINPTNNAGNLFNTNEKIASLFKEIENSKNKADQNQNFQFQNKKYTNSLLKERNFSRSFTKSIFSPPKSKKSQLMYRQVFQLSPGLEKMKDSKQQQIDDREFRSKFSLQLNRTLNIDKSIEKDFKKDPISKNYNQELQIKLENYQKNKYPEKQSVKQTLKLDINVIKESFVNRKKQYPNQIMQEIEKKIIKKQSVKVDNEYFLQDQTIEGNQEQKKQNTKDRTEKGLVNAAKKLNNKINNKNFSVEQVFIEQQLLAREQQQQRKRSQNNQDQLVRRNNQPISQDDRQRVVQSHSLDSQKANTNHQTQSKQDLEEIVELISPIKLIQNVQNLNPSTNVAKKNSLSTHFELKRSQLEEKIKLNHSQSNSIQTQNKQVQKSQYKPKIMSDSQNATTQIKKTVGKNQSDSQQLGMMDLVEMIEKLKQPPTSQVKNQKIQLKFQNKLDPIDIQTNIQEAKFLQRKPSISLKRKLSSQNQERKTVTFAREKQQILNSDFNHNNIDQCAIPSQQEKTQPKKEHDFKQPKKDSKKVNKIPSDYEQELEQIKFTTPIIKPQQTNKKTSIAKSQKQVDNDKLQQSNKKHVLQKPPLPQGSQGTNQKTFFASQPQTSCSKPKAQVPHVSPTNSARKKQKEPKRQHTVESSVASSHGPHKSVKKIVDEYITMVNKIGQAVAKSPKVSKKIQKATEWYVGVYFLYKRFLYERKKIEKYLKEGTPKLTRYEEEINLDEWKQYLKSSERQALITRLSDENINIAQSMQKMQVKLLTRNIPQSVKSHAAISQRSSRQSGIAVDAVIDEFDCLVEKGMLEDEEILAHCTEMLNACLIIAELDQLVEDVVPLSEIVKPKRTFEQLQIIAQDLFDLYHDQ